jgi:hypothetical protein
VRDGEEVLVGGRNKPVARIVPCRLQGHSEQEQRLVARSVLTPPLAERVVSLSWPEPPGNISDEGMGQVWRKEGVMRVPVFWDTTALFPSAAKNGPRIFTIAMLGTPVGSVLLTGSLHQEGGVVSFAIGISVSYSLCCGSCTGMSEDLCPSRFSTCRQAKL